VFFFFKEMCVSNPLMHNTIYVYTYLKMDMKSVTSVCGLPKKIKLKENKVGGTNYNEWGEIWWNIFPCGNMSCGLIIAWQPPGQWHEMTDS